MKKLFIILTSLFLTGAAVHAVYYDIGKNGDNKVNVSWESKASLETIIGRTIKATGFIFFDTKSARHEVRISIPVDSMKTGIELRDTHMRSPAFLDAAQYPTIEFQSSSIKSMGGDNYTIKGTLTIHGKTREVTVRGTAKRYPAKPELVKMGYVGDIIHLETSFAIKLSDYGVIIPANMLGLKMADQLTIKFDIFGFTNDAPDRRPDAAKVEQARPPAMTGAGAGGPSATAGR